MEYSKKRLSRAKEENVDIKQMAVAELMAWGWDSLDAMLAVGMLNDTDGKAVAQHAALTYTSEQAFASLLKKRKQQLKNGAVLDEYQKLHPTPGSPISNRGAKRADGSTRKVWQGDAPEPIADEEVLAAMWETITKLSPSDPKRVDLLDKYDKLKRRQGGNSDDTTIHFYLPRPECDTCPFRGGHVITDPEIPEEKAKPEPQETKEEDTDDLGEFDDSILDDTPEPGYTKNGKKVGRPPKRKYKTDKPKPAPVFETPPEPVAQKTPEEEAMEALGSAFGKKVKPKRKEAPIDLFDLSEDNEQ